MLKLTSLIAAGRPHISASCCPGSSTHFAARAASTATSGAEVLSPAVAFLVGAKRIDASIVRRLPRSGPKHRLLKGDVLRYLANPTIVDNPPDGPGPATSAGTVVVEEAFIPAAYYSARVNVSDLVAFVKNYNDERRTTLTVSDFFTRAAYLALKAVPEASARWVESSNTRAALEPTSIFLTRLSPFGVTSARTIVANPEDVGATKLAKTFVASLSSSPSSPAFSVYDAVLSPFAELNPYPSTAEPVIFSIGPIAKERPRRVVPASARSLDPLDVLAGLPSKSSPSSVSSSAPTIPSAKAKDQAPQANVVLQKLKTAPQQTSHSAVDEIDFLAKPSPSGFYTGSFASECEPHVDYIVPVDLTVDRRAVSAKAAGAFLKTWEKLLKTPKALL
ncbi:hypothetical protein HDU87_003236 [Geranomyces variabilis]|uniref:2-oxoacid dehydrogenase acyltransferase catalytic domain-containing protein n=1 Tax=Geranomyces variabilis TaxID=109894 RepID=A0AAD5XRJ1_9FUNG|nr:hypothetical protein HDU87_003236 [Geranomyces variabilis]